MKRLRATLAVSTLFLLLCPATSYAHIGWWDWLGELSGPGPFHHRGPTVDWRVLCRVHRTKGTEGTVWASDGRRLERGSQQFSGVPGSVRLGAQLVGQILPCSATPGYTDRVSGDRVSEFVEVRYGSVRTGDKAVFSDVPGPVGIVTARHLQVTVFHQLRVGGVAVGAGAGWLRFSGKPLDRTPNRITITPLSIVVKPLELLGRRGRGPGSDFLIVRYDLMGIMGGLKATDFVSTSTSAFSANAELKGSAYVILNLAAMLR